MKTTLEFDTEDPEQEQDLKRVMKAKDMALAIWKIQQDIRGKLKNIPDDYQPAYEIGLQEAQELINEVLEDYDINLDKILS